MDTLLKFPRFAKASLLLIGLYVFINILSITQDILVPLIFSMMIAVLLNPLVKFFVRMRINRVVAIFLTLILTFIITAAIAALIFRQIGRFSESWPLLVYKFELLLQETV
ncbi:MAG: AI-2E family transporter [Lutibacter sp.]|nr:AI-2E family transporter [Lutibacter sp.]MBP9600365.1 AI-2E family transporter [Lutibacter sp.]